MEISEIKNRLSIESVLDRYNLTPDKRNQLCCPFHEEKTASFTIYPKTKTFHCFGCGVNGDCIEFIQLKEASTGSACSKHEAIMKAQSFIEPLPGVNEPIIKPKPKPEAPQTPEEKTAILAKIFEIFKNGLHHPTSIKPKEYLAKRNLSLPLLGKAGWGLGYNSGQFHHRGSLSEADQGACIKAGLLIPYNGVMPNAKGATYTAFAKDCIIFPLRNEQSQIASIYGRSINENINGTGKHFYLKDRSGLYPFYPEPNTTRLILTEAIIDAATLLQISPIPAFPQGEGVSILACYGTNGLTEEHRAAIKGLKNLQEIIFFFDGDKAGREGARHHGETLHQLLPGVKISFVATPQDEDINSLSQGHEAELFTHFLENRKELSFLTELSEAVSRPEGVTPIKKESPITANQLITTSPYRIEYTTDTACYSVKGGIGKQLDSLRVSLDIAPIAQHNPAFLKYRTKVDLYEDKQVQKLSHEAAEKLGLRADLLEMDLNRFTGLLEQYRESQLTENSGKPKEKAVYVPFATERQCMAFLNTPGLINRINGLIGLAGVTGEENSRLFLFIIASSYKMPDTLHALIQGSSGSGKTRLLKIISQLMPPEDVKRFTRVTESSFYNYDEHYFVHKLICFEDVDGLKEEAQFAVRELMSNEVLSSSTSIKDGQGNISGQERVVRGPIASISCTTHGGMYEDNMSRVFIIAVDESREQTARVIDYQNKKAAGFIDKKKEQGTTEFLQNCIRLLKPYEVVNPYADKIRLPEQAHKIRRLTELYHAFVKQITLINQYQRKKDEQSRLIAEKEDLQTACDILFESIVLKVDELDGSLRQFYEHLKGYIKKQGQNYQDYQFTQREARQALHISKTQMFRYITHLIGLEYIGQSGGYTNKGLKYKVVYWDSIEAIRDKVKKHLKDQLDKL